MGWDYAYGVRWEGQGSGTALSAYADDVRILPEQSPALRSSLVTVANRHGQRAPSKTFYNGWDFILQVLLSYGTPELPANVYQNRSEVLRLLTHPQQRVWLQRTAPYQGAVELPVVVTRPPRTANPRHRLLVACRALGFWRDQAVTHNAANPVPSLTVGGDAPIQDAVLTFSGHNGPQRLTHTDTGDWVEVDADTTVTPVVVDCGTGVATQGGSPIAGLTAGQPWLLELMPGTNNFTLSGLGSVALTARDQWL